MTTHNQDQLADERMIGEGCPNELWPGFSVTRVSATHDAETSPAKEDRSKKPTRPQPSGTVAQGWNR